MGSMAIQGDQKPEATESVRRKGCLFWLGHGGLLAAGILLLGVALVSAGFEALQPGQIAAHTYRRKTGRWWVLPVTYPLPGRRQPHCHPGERSRRSLADVGLDPTPAGCQRRGYGRL